MDIFHQSFLRNFVMHCPYFLVSLSVKQGREQGYTTEWLPAIATYLNESGRSLEVVFEEYPLKDREPGGYEAVLLYYNVSLILLHDRSVAYFKKVLMLIQNPVYRSDSKMRILANGQDVNVTFYQGICYFL